MHAAGNRFCRVRIVGAIAALSLVVTAVGAQGSVADSNFPAPNGRYILSGGVGLIWTYVGYRPPGLNRFTPIVCFMPRPLCGPKTSGEYLGFIDGTGSLVENYRGGDRGVYLFNGAAHTLTKQYDSITAVPAGVLAVLRNREYVFDAPQDKVGVAVGTGPVPGALKGQEPDPNLPLNLGNDGQTGFPLAWQMYGSTTQPSVTIRVAGRAAGMGLYLGFNERGSWVVSLGDNQVYVWNLQTKSLIVGAANGWGTPLDLANPSPLMQAILYYDAHQYSSAQGEGPRPDPNFPPTLTESAQLGLPVRWSYADDAHPGNIATNLSLLLKGTPEMAPANYLGFNARGAWLRDQNDNRVYAWDFKTLQLVVLASRLTTVPASELASLHNADRKLLAALIAAQ
jgi:hypothetical protein